MEIGCQSEISSVTVHARGALVTRKVTPSAEVPAGDVDLVVPGVTLLAEGGSVRASLQGAGRSIVSVQTALFVPEAAGKPSISAERLAELEAQVERAELELAWLRNQRGRLASLRPQPVLGGRFRKDGVDTRFADALAFGTLTTEILARLDERAIGLERRLLELRRERDGAQLVLAQATSQEQRPQGTPTRRITVRVAGSGALGGLEVSYAVPAARWWPLYTLRLSEAGQKASLALEALVAQRSGEDWAGVPLSLSTADLVLDSQLPELASLRLGRAQPPKRASYRPPPAGLDRLFDGYDRAFAGAQSPPEPVPATTIPAYHREDGNMPSDAPWQGAPLGGLQEQTADKSVLMDLEEAEGGRGMDRGAARPSGARHAATTRGAPAAPGNAPMAAPMAPPASFAMPVAAFRAPQAKGGVISGAFGAVAGAAGAVVGAVGELADALPARRRSESTGSAMPYGGEAAAIAEPEPEEPSIEPGQAWLDFASLSMASAMDRSKRGRLVLARDAAAGQRHSASSAIDGLSPGVDLRDPRETRGHFDHRYEAAGRCEVPSDGQTHRLALKVTEGKPRVRFRAVPREDPQVFREVELQNPFDAPLLAGPVEVYVEGSLLTTSQLDRVDKGGKLTVGMGVEERVRVARNVRADEENAGLLGGTTAVTHTVTIELTSSLPVVASMEVVDRLPVTDDKTIEVKLQGSTPEAETYKQEDRGSPVRGGLRWKFELASGEKKKLELKYRVSFNAKDELVGGNRRD